MQIFYNKNKLHTGPRIHSIMSYNVSRSACSIYECNSSRCAWCRAFIMSGRKMIGQTAVKLAIHETGQNASLNTKAVVLPLSYITPQCVGRSHKHFCVQQRPTASKALPPLASLLLSNAATLYTFVHFHSMFTNWSGSVLA